MPKLRVVWFSCLCLLAMSCGQSEEAANQEPATKGDLQAIQATLADHDKQFQEWCALYQQHHLAEARQLAALQTQMAALGLPPRPQAVGDGTYDPIPLPALPVPDPPLPQPPPDSVPTVVVERPAGVVAMESPFPEQQPFWDWLVPRIATWSQIDARSRKLDDDVKLRDQIQKELIEWANAQTPPIPVNMFERQCSNNPVCGSRLTFSYPPNDPFRHPWIFWHLHTQEGGGRQVLFIWR